MDFGILFWVLEQNLGSIFVYGREVEARGYYYNYERGIPFCKHQTISPVQGMQGGRGKAGKYCLSFDLHLCFHAVIIKIAIRSQHVN